MGNIEIEYTILRKGIETNIMLIPYGAGGGTISVTMDAAIKLTLSTQLQKSSEIDYINDRLAVHIVIDGVRHAMGRYVVTTAPEARTQDSVSVTITAYGLCYLLQCCTVDARRYYGAGTKYTDVFGALLLEAGLSDFKITPSGATLSLAREFEPGTDLLSILNALLKELNYNTVWETMDGVVMCTPAKTAVSKAGNIVYMADAYSLLYPEASTESDSFERYNRFVCIVDSSKAALALRSEAINDRADSPISTVNQGRRVTLTTVYNDIADQATLDAVAQRLKLDSMMRTTETTFYTGPNPVHGAFDVVQLRNGYEDGVYDETYWSIALSVPYRMEHRGRKMVFI